MTARALHKLAAIAALAASVALAGAARAQGLDAEDENESSNPSSSSADEGGSDDAKHAPADTAASQETPAQAGNERSSDESVEGPRVTISPFAGFGLGTRAFQRPTPIGGQSLRTVAFPAADVGLAVTAWPKASFSLGVLLRYQTSIGMRIDEHPPFALANQVGARSERAELSVAPTFRIGDNPLAPAVAFPIGLGIRTLWPWVHNGLTPGYSLIGPMLRAELLVPLGDVLRLRLGPELQWIVLIDRSIRRDGVDSQAFSVGGELAMTLALGSSFALDLSYREAHAGASSVNGGELFRDVERYLTLRLLGVL